MSLLLFVLSILSILAEVSQMQLIRNFQYNANGLIKVAVFEKLLKLGNKASKEFNEGRILSMTNVDAEQFSNSLPLLTNLINLPLQISFTLYFLIRLIGSAIWPSAVVLLVSLVCLVPVGAALGANMKNYMMAEDGRSKTLREMLVGIKVVKMRAEEEVRKKRVMEMREKQLNALETFLKLFAVMVTLLLVPHVVMPIALPSPVPSLSWEETPKPVLTKAEEAKAKAEAEKKAAEKKARAVENDGEEEEEDERRGLNLKIKKGKITAIVGPVGSGKSSLLSAILGNMTLTTGSVTATGSISICQQQPWLHSSTILSNLLLLRTPTPDDLSQLPGILTACGLDKDLSHLPSGIHTQVGEKGVTLSGGQKARIALARAAMDQSEVVLMDDPLVWRGCVRGCLEGRTRVVVTQRLEVVEEGVDWTSTASQRTSTTSTAPPTPPPPTPSATPSATLHRLPTLIAEEDRQRGGLRLSVLKGYWKRAGGVPVVVGIASVMMVLTVSSVVRDLWLVWWSEERFGWSFGGYLGGYLGVGGVNVVGMLGVSFSFSIAGFFAGKQLHNDALERLLRAPMSFFDSQPVGRILNRMSKDVEGIDKSIGILYLNVFLTLSTIIANLVSLTYTTPYILVLFVVLSVSYSYLLELYRNSSRELKRIVAVERSPLHSHVSECLGGVECLRAFKAEERAAVILRDLLDKSNGPLIAQANVKIWLNFRIQFFSCIIILFVSLFGVLTTSFAASLMGLAISTATTLTEQLSYLIMFTASLEAEMVAVERVLEYCNTLPQEPAALLPTDPPATSWPSKGVIEFRDLNVKYATSEAVVKNVSLTIRGGESVAIVGRTGSGKSTLLAALFRLVEAESGGIWIDGVNIVDVGVGTLRGRMQIIPQEPVMFAGPLRENVDPTGMFDDATVWDALDRVGLKSFVVGKEQGLEFMVDENGGNLSMGQRQLIMLARAMCFNPKILVMDEASSSVDGMADTLIQETLATQFRDATVVSIAHRISSVAGFDRVVVLEMGRVVECDSPARLLRIEGGVFRKLVDAGERRMRR
ncbi:P-loop containing nucleoside triphosphate hydrolase protein [Chytridium lagenaria]|nr:P-loop containing nucleoside triphosphate hydrolase protein [Chytridium lagenaria]